MHNVWIRFRQILGYAALLLFAGVLYGIFVDQTGIAIPCVFHEVTGLRCPGCGVTRMCIALMHLDFSGAFRHNPMLFILAVPLAFVFLKYIVDYIKNGQWKMNRIQKWIIYVSIVLLVGFGIMRNIVKI